MTYDELQADHKEWVEREYPGQTPEIPAAGVVEESAELLHAVLKLEQQKRWGRDDRYRQLEVDVVDAVGDCAIYVCSLCNAKGWSFAHQMTGAMHYETAGLHGHLEMCTELVEYAADLVKRLYIARNAFAYVGVLKGVSRALGVDFDNALFSTWSVVRRRVRRAGAPAVQR